MAVLIPRKPWPAGFPEVVIHNELRVRNTHPAYSAAKSGDAEAARALADDLLSAAETQRLAYFLAGRQPVLVAVTADEVTGYNAIPDGMAQILGACLGLEVAYGTIAQANKVGHTKANGWHRLVTPAEFSGVVSPETDYFLVDDHVGFDGTLANLRGFIEHWGGHVIGMTTLTETRAARQISVRPETLAMLYERHGRELERFWCRRLGHGLDCLTDVEAGYLCRVESVAAIENRMAEATEQARGRGLSAAEDTLDAAVGGSGSRWRRTH